jgi:hypothetical protein
MTTEKTEAGKYQLYADGYFIEFIMVTIMSLLASWLSSILAIIGLSLAVYLALKGFKKTTWLKRIRLGIGLVLVVNVTLTTAWYGFLGNYLDPQLAPIWKSFDCSPGDNKMYCPTLPIKNRDELFRSRSVSSTMGWWAKANWSNDYQDYKELYLVYGLAIYLPMPD